MRALVLLSFAVCLAAAGPSALSQPAAADTNAPAAPATNQPPAVLTTNAPASATNDTSPAPSTNATPRTAPEPVPPPAPTRLDPQVYRVRTGFTIELVAAEPLVFSPSAMAFDEEGRLFVTEMRDWPGRRDAFPHLGRVRMLEDTDSDGTFDASTVLADQLPLPSAIACYKGGVFVGVTPDIIYLKAAQAAGTATVHRVMFEGFGGTNAVDPERLLGSFTWGPDLRIHGLASALGGVVRSPAVPTSPEADLGINDFAFEPRTLALTAVTGPGQSGLAFDARGRKLVTERERPLRQVMTSAACYGRNPFYAPAPALMDVLNPATPVYAASGSTNAASTWLKSARAMLVYRGGMFPPGYQDNVFIADDEAQVIHRVVLRETGLLVGGSRAAEDVNSEFFRCTDPDFRPRHLAVGPDGALYVADLRSGGGQGRIYRIAPAGLKAGRKTALAKATTHELALLLAHTNSWQRETASRLLYEQQDPATPVFLTNIVLNGRLPQARMEAVSLLAALGQTNENWVLRALRDTDERVRQRTVQAVGRLAAGRVPDAVWTQLETMAEDPSIQVRREVAWAVGEISRPERLPVLAGIVRRDPGDPWIRDAVLSSLGQGAGHFFAGLARNAAFRRSSEGQSFLREVAGMIGTTADAESVPVVIDWLANGGVPPRENLGLLAALGEGLRNANVSLLRVDPTRRLQPMYLPAFDAVADSGLPLATRLDAARVLGLGMFTYEEAAALLLFLPGASEFLPIQTAAVTALGHYQTPAFVDNLVARWSVLPPGLYQPALSAMLLSVERVPQVLTALERGALPNVTLLGEQANLLRFYPSPDVSARAIALLGAANTYRDEAIERYRPSLSLRGAPERGRQIFQARCAACHQVGADGQRLGPNLTGVKMYGKAAVATAILEPNSQIRANYETWLVQTRGRENYVGVVERPHPSTIILRRPGGIPMTFPVSALEYHEPQSWSLMPNGLEQGLSEQDFADLLDFLMTYPQGGSAAAAPTPARTPAAPVRATP